jgi:LuxR family maltose regulon positive regulatory protein
MSGQRALAAESIARAERLVGTRPGPLPDGFSSAEASLATLRAVFPWGNVREAHSHALRALELEGPASPWHPLVIWALARAHLWRGELAEADTLFRDAIAIATSRDHWLMASAALAYRSLIAGHEGRLADQARLARESEVLACEHGLEHHTCGPSMALGKSLTDRGRPSEAAPVLERAVEIARPQGQPLVLARALRYLTEALTALGRQDEAAAVSAEARDVLASCVDPASLAGTVSVSPRSPSSPGSAVVDQLTPRELTVLSFLAGDLSEADIGREMFVSHSTVHSHARSIYRKLGASSRAEALERAKAEGYL